MRKWVWDRKEGICTQEGDEWHEQVRISRISGCHGGKGLVKEMRRTRVLQRASHSCRHEQSGKTKLKSVIPIHPCENINTFAFILFPTLKFFKIFILLRHPLRQTGKLILDEIPCTVLMLPCPLWRTCESDGSEHKLGLSEMWFNVQINKHISLHHLKTLTLPTAASTSSNTSLQQCTQNVTW